MGGYLYCARAGNYIKIGFSVNPGNRMYGLRSELDRTRCPARIQRKDVRMEGQIAADKAQEYEFHRQFAYECIEATEWYPLGGEAHSAFQEYIEKGLVPPVPEKPPVKRPEITGINPLVDPIEWALSGDSHEDPIERAVWILEGRKTELRIQRYKSSLTDEEDTAWFSLDRASQYLCRQL